MISIIIPTLNEEKIIASTILALKSALTLPHEIIVTDGKSTDKTVAIAKQDADQVVVYQGEKRQTIAQGRNAGAQAARGDYFVFLDADCTIPDPNQFFQRALTHFAQEPRLVALTVSLYVLPENETWADRLFSMLVNIIFKFQNNVLGRGISTGEFQMIRREAFEQVRGFREDLVAAEDGDIFYRLSQIGRTLSDSQLKIFHTGRRIHRLGWPKLLWLWFLNTVAVSLFNHSASKEWAPIR